jgi:hypothetical protein
MRNLTIAAAVVVGLLAYGRHSEAQMQQRSQGYKATLEQCIEQGWELAQCHRWNSRF